MDCKPEPAARTFCRITLLAIEGMIAAVLRLLIGILLIPFNIVTRSIGEARQFFGGWRWMMLPLAVCIGVWRAVINPFVICITTLRDGVEICAEEWRGRWLAAVPKKPDGTPIDKSERVGAERG